MTRSTIAALLGGAPLALCPDSGAGLLSVAVPDVDAPVTAGQGMALGPVEVERGQRFAISGGLAVVPVSGLLTPNFYMLERYMGWATYHGLARTMEELAANEDVRGIAMLVDSPGGMVVGIEAAAAAVASAGAIKPVHALVNPLAASAAYWLTSQATEISLTPGSWVGSIGIMRTNAWPVQAGSSGMQAFLQMSRHAGAKRADPTTEEGRQLAQLELDEMEAAFHATVAAGRDIPVDDLPGRLTRDGDVAHGGGTFAGEDARSRGLVDQLETEAAFFARLAGLYAPSPRRPRGVRSARAAAAAAQALSSI